MEVNERIKSLLNELGVNRAAFAETIGMQPSAISHIINGRNRPSIEMLQKIAEHYPEVDIHYLVTGIRGHHLPLELKKSYNNSIQSAEKELFSDLGEGDRENFSSTPETPLELTEKRVTSVITLYSDGTAKEYICK